MAGPAVDVQTLYTAAAQVNRITIGGFTPTVGAAGGYIIGGGTGPIGPHYGLGVDSESRHLLSVSSLVLHVIMSSL